MKLCIVSLLVSFILSCGCQESNTLQFNIQKSLKSVVTAEYEGRIVGAGVVIKSEKITVILTANHVVIDQSTNKPRNNMEFSGHKFRIYYNDPKYDLALLVTEKPIKGANSSYIANYSAIKGSSVYIIGSPIGIPYNVTFGIISNIVGSKSNIYYLTDADCTNGNSGGGLFARGGELLGIASIMVIGGQNYWSSCSAVHNSVIHKFLNEAGGMP